MSLSDQSSPAAGPRTVKPPLRVGVLVSGNGSNLQSIIDHAEAGRIPAVVACVISNKAGAFALERARNHSIPNAVLDHRDFPDRESFDTAMVGILRENGVELVALAGFNRIVSKVMLNAFPQAILNIHPALLPAFPGNHAQRQAVEHGVKIAGCTVHFVDSGTDSGPIIAQAAVPVLANDSEESLSRRILQEEHKIYPEVIRLYAEGRIRVDGRQVLISRAQEPDGRFLENPPL